MKKMMRLAHFACFLSLTATFVVMTAGCTPFGHTRQNQAELTEENSKQRARIYRDRTRMEEFQRENDMLRRKIEELQAQINTRQQIPNRMRQIGPATSPADGSVRGQSAPDIPSVKETARTAPRQILPSPDNAAVSPTPPAVEKGPPSSDVPDNLFNDSSAEEPLTLPNLLPEATPIHPPTGSFVPDPGAGGTPRKWLVVRKTDSSTVQRVQIMKSHVRPLNYDGLHLEFQMLDAQNQIVLAAAPLTVMVTDPTLPEQQAVIAQWDYSAADIAEMINAGQAAISIPLNMEWEKGCPQNLKLQIHVMFVTSDGRRLVDRVYMNLEELAFAGQPLHTLADITPPAEMAATVGHVGANAGNPETQPRREQHSSPQRAEDRVPMKRPVWTPEP